MKGLCHKALPSKGFELKGFEKKGFVKGLCEEWLYRFAYKECPWGSWAYAKGFVKGLCDEFAPSRVQRASSDRA